MLKINMNVFKCKNDNASAAPLRSQIFENFEKMKKFKENFEKYRSFEFHRRKIRSLGMKRHSTSPPCGNLVDGLPHDCHNTETIAKLARLGPAENDEPMQNFVELSMF